MSMDSQVEVNGGGRNSGGFLKRGTKRDASDSNLSDIERFEKRLRMLSLRGAEQNGSDKSNIYTPVSNTPIDSTSNVILHANHGPSQPENELMQVDDTRDRIYVHDLDAELEEIESNNGKERLIFLPDIEKHFSKLPQQVLSGAEEGSRELVLYDVPKSLSVDEGHDSVRKAIIEYRQRAREKAEEEAGHATPDANYGDDVDNTAGANANGYFPACFEEHTDNDPDAMDIS